MRALSLLILLWLAAPAGAAPKLDPERVADLISGKLEPAEAAAAWRERGLSPEAALEALRKRKLRPQVRPGLHEVELTDGHERQSSAYLHVPSKAYKKGRYRVLIMLHGIGGNSKGGFELAASLAPKGTLVIGPTALKPRGADKPEDLPDLPLLKPLLSKFPLWWSYRERSFPLQALRFLLQRFPVDTDRVVLIGYSMGGFGTWNLGLRFHERFAGASPMAGGVSRQEFAPLGRDQRTRHLLGNARMLPLFFLHGDADSVVPVRFDRWSAEDLGQAGLPFVYEEVPQGEHVMSDQLGRGPLREKLIRWIASQEREAHPRRVEHHAIAAYHGAAYWVRLDELSGAKARVVAVARKQTIRVVCEGVKTLSLHLDPELVDPGKTVKVFVNGRGLFKGKVAPRLEAVAETFARSGDVALTYAHQLRLELPGDLPSPQAGDWGLR